MNIDFLMTFCLHNSWRTSNLSGKQDHLLLATGKMLDGYSGVLSERPTKSLLFYDVPLLGIPPKVSPLSNVKSFLPSIFFLGKHQSLVWSLNCTPLLSKPHELSSHSGLWFVQIPNPTISSHNSDICLTINQ